MDKKAIKYICTYTPVTGHPLPTEYSFDDSGDYTGGSECQEAEQQTQYINYPTLLEGN